VFKSHLLKKSQSNQKSFLLAFLLQNQQIINQAHASARLNGLACGDDHKQQVPSNVPSRKGLAKNNKAKVRLFVTAEQVVAGKCAPPGRKFRQLNNAKEDTGYP